MLHGYQGDALARTCVTKLAAFLEDSDQNRKYSYDFDQIPTSTSK